MLFQRCGVLSLVLLSLPLCLAATSASAPPVNLKGSAQDITYTQPDPKTPGKLLYYLRAAEADGHSDPDGSFHGRITKVWMRLYQKGVPSAVLTAPLALGGGTSKAIIITGTGGVVVKSLALNEMGTKLSADQVVWYSSSDTIVATGHVIYYNGRTGAMMTGPRAVADTKLETLKIVSGHASATL